MQEKSIPPFSQLYLSEYLQYWQNSYEEALKQASVPEKLLETNEKTIEAHLCKHFNRLRNIIDDDYFEWNQAMMVFLTLCQWRNGVSDRGIAMEEFCKENNLLQPLASRLRGDRSVETRGRSLGKVT